MDYHYRVFRFPDGHMALHEVKQDTDGNPISISGEPANFSFTGEHAREDIRDALHKALDATLQQTVLSIDEDGALTVWDSRQVFKTADLPDDIKQDIIDSRPNEEELRTNRWADAITPLP